MSSPTATLTNLILHCRYSVYTQSGPQPTTGIADLGNRPGPQGTQALRYHRVSLSGMPVTATVFYVIFLRAPGKHNGQSTMDFYWARGSGTDFLSILNDFPLSTSFNHTHIHPLISVYVMWPTLKYTTIMNKYYCIFLLSFL
jgi:hypothetical protein